MQRSRTAAAAFTPDYGDYEKPAALGRGGAIGPFTFMRQITQGACAGLLTFLGANHLAAGMESGAIGPLPPGGFAIQNLQGILESYAIGGLPGIMEIAGAVGLFLNAGRGIGRILGLSGFVAVAIAHANGMTHDDVLTTLTGLTDVVAPTLSASFGL